MVSQADRIGLGFVSKTFVLRLRSFPFSATINLLSCNCIPEQHGRCLGNTEHLKKKTTSALSNPHRKVMITPKSVRIFDSFSFSHTSHFFIPFISMEYDLALIASVATWANNLDEVANLY